MISTNHVSKILIVDDLPTNIRLLAQILGHQYEILIATDGESALEIAALESPDLVLLDIMMPEMDGYEVCARLKSKESTRDILVIFVTALGDEENEVRGLELGAVDYITKPFGKYLVQARVRNHLARRLAERTISRMHHSNRLILDTAGEGIFGLNNEGMTTFINRSGAQMLGWEKEQLQGKFMHSLIHGKRADGSSFPFDVCPICAALKDGNIHNSGDEVFWRRDGSSFPVQYTSTPIMDGKSIIGTVAVFRDITSQRDKERREIHSQASRIAISALLETGLEPLSLDKQLNVAMEIIMNVPWLSIELKGSIFIYDENSKELVLRAEKGLAKPLLSLCARVPLGYCLCGKAAETLQTVFANKLDKNHDISFEGIHNHGHYCIPIILNKKLMGILNCYVPAGMPYSPEEEAFLITMANTLAGIIERRRLEEKLEDARKQLAYAAVHDDLTGLPNRVLFRERLGQSLTRARRDKNLIGLLFIDLDRFKQVNDTLGHTTGDRLLVEVGRRVSALLRESDSLARMGGDEFAVILDKISNEDDAIIVAKKIIAKLQEPFHLNPHVCQIGSSIGITLFPSHGVDLETLMKRADAAMYAVKQSGRNNCCVFQEGMISKEGTM